MRDMLHLKVNLVALRLLDTPTIKDVSWTYYVDEVVYEIEIGNYDGRIIWSTNIQIAIPNEFFTIFNEEGVATLIIGEIRKQLNYTIQ